MQQECLRWRCHYAHVSQLGRSYDVRNAFASLAFNSIIDSVCGFNANHNEVRPFVEQRVKEAVTTTEVVGGKTTFLHQSGAMHGDGVAHEFFASPYETQTKKWLEDTSDEHMFATVPFPIRR